VLANVEAGNILGTLMKKYSRIIIFFCIVSVSLLSIFQDALSQTDTEIAVNRPDTSMSQGSHHSLFTGLGYGSNLIYLGSSISQDQQFEYSALTYGYRNALYATVSAVHLSNRSPFVAFYTGSISYSHVFNSWFDISASISRYQVTPSLADTLFNSFFYSDLTLGFDWKLLYTKISGGSLFSDENTGYLQVRNSRYFETPEFTKKRTYFSFDPYFSFLFGKLTEIRTTEGTSVSISPPYRKGGKYGNNSPATTISSSFGLMEIDFGIPVTFNFKKFAIEAEPGYILTLYDDPEYPGTRGFVLLVSGYLRIF
jgi:hypothetical protein